MNIFRLGSLESRRGILCRFFPRLMQVMLIAFVLSKIAIAAEGEQAPIVQIPPEYNKLVVDLNTSPKEEGPYILGYVFKYRLPNAQELRDYPVLWEFLPPARNAAFIYAQAIMHYDRSLEPPAGSRGAAESYLGDISAFQQYVEKNERAIALMKQAAEYEQCTFPVICTLGSKESPASSHTGIGVLLAGVRQMVRTLSDAAFLAEETEKPAKAAELCLAGIRMGKHVSRGHNLCLMVGTACTHIAEETLVPVMANNDLPDTMLKEIIREAEYAELSHSDLRRCYEMEQARWEYVLLQSDFDLSSYFDPAPSNVQAIAMVRGISGNARGILDHPLEEIFDEHDNLVQRLSEGVEKQPYSEHLVDEFARLHMFVGEHNARLRLLQIRAAIELYEAEHGKPPANLEDLVPAYLEAVPIDPFSGKPFHYITLGKAWKVYSIGRDRRDTGGLRVAHFDTYGPNGEPITKMGGDVTAKSLEMSERLSRMRHLWGKDWPSDVAKALIEHPKMADLYYTRAEEYDREYRHEITDEAILSDLNRAIELDPEHVYALRLRADVLVDAFEPERAIKDLTRVIEIDPFNGIETGFENPFHRRARVYTALERYDEAWADMRMCRQINYPVDPNFLTELENASGHKE